MTTIPIKMAIEAYRIISFSRSVTLGANLTVRSPKRIGIPIIMITVYETSRGET
ncbi:MAG: hypothetical protein BWY95_00794 [Bacteroidetes bacterium ADurb.BinA104]|nr:MAG: hypothetical protein BWY95_00794 [Bacteroidetes bacterium ADurb.BinA104]